MAASPVDPEIHDASTILLQELVNVQFHSEGNIRLHFTSGIEQCCGSVDFSFFITRTYDQSELGVQVYELHISESAQKLVETLRRELCHSTVRDYLIYLRVVRSEDVDEDLSIFDIHCFIGEYTYDDQ